MTPIEQIAAAIKEVFGENPIPSDGFLLVHAAKYNELADVMNKSYLEEIERNKALQHIWNIAADHPPYTPQEIEGDKSCEIGRAHV
mgnify:CR=1 FL=1